MKSINPLLNTAQNALQSAQFELNANIAAYPTPISGCDAQFNHLLAERSRIHNALSALTDDIFIPTPRTPNQGDRVESR